MKVNEMKKKKKQTNEDSLEFAILTKSSIPPSEMRTLTVFVHVWPCGVIHHTALCWWDISCPLVAPQHYEGIFLQCKK